MTAPAIEGLLRELTPRVLEALVRRYGQFEACEDAVQEAVLAATVQWPAGEVPDNPHSWLVAVASRRLIDQMRSDHARRERESAMAAEVVPEDVPDTDDTLVLLFLCCHPTLTPASQTALTLRCCPYGRTCWRRLATRPARTSTTGAPRRPPPAWPSNVTCSPGPAG